MESARFATTQWTVVLQATGEGPQRAAAFERFCQAYWYPIYAFIRRLGHTPEDAGDLTQEFFARLLAKNWLAGVEPRATRFSTLLLTILKRFLANAYEHAQRMKRGGGQAPVSIDFAQAENWFGAEPFTDETPEKTFARRWALAILDAALGRLRAEAGAAGKSFHFQTLNPFLSHESEAGDYEKAGAALAMSARAVAVAVRRLRARYRDLIRKELAGGRLDRAQLDEEMRAFFSALTQGA